MAEYDLTQFENAEALARAAASAWLDEIERAHRAGRSYHVALSGGRIAGVLFSEVTRQAKRRNAVLGHVHFFWADERCVPPDDADSNFRVAQQLLLDPLGIAENRIHRVRVEISPKGISRFDATDRSGASGTGVSPVRFQTHGRDARATTSAHAEADTEAAAREAEAEIRRIVPLAPDGQPMLDLILLGMGEDGHVASLFPGEPEAVVSSPAVYRVVTAPKPPPRRVTLGYGVMAAAREVWVLISGVGKEAALRESLLPQGRTPLATVLRSRSRTRIFSDLPLKP